ncbi:TPA: hypothetical protein JDJ86_003924 [Salmonella enterica subsp. houtenae]|nr:hypothetical protein [Salmonella enterica subsp. enterica]HAU3311456.1 hypothetical protein [Salmonella enterica subsp. houtenae]
MKMLYGFRSTFRDEAGEPTDHLGGLLAHQLVEEIAAVPAGGNPAIRNQTKVDF